MLSLNQLLNQYKQEKKAISAFNIDCFEIYQAIEEVVAETNLPCIVQLSPNQDQFIQAERLFLLVKKANIEGLPIYLNMDHGKDPARLEKLAKLGFDMIHFDGSIFDYDKNLDLAKTLIDKIKSLSLNTIVEVEFNRIKAIDNSTSQDIFTKPDQAKDFILKSKANLLAVSIGNLHGVNINRPEQLDISLLSKIATNFPTNSFFTLHGGSGIPQDQIKQAINLGVVKVNINTDLRLKFRDSLRNSINNTNSEKIYEYMTPVINDLKEIIKEKLIQLS
ncbi:class II fructose-bisphosphate aldolase [Candidatus Parcubacteria bacterium]|nr:class II fructose-bisphosphate aldolase [Candidatus Parcubacteria bacterium]